MFLLYTLGRLAIAAALIGLLWALGLPGTPGFLFGVLLAMPVSFLVLGPVLIGALRGTGQLTLATGVLLGIGLALS